MKAKDVIKGIEEGFDDNEQIADAVEWVEDAANRLAELEQDNHMQAIKIEKMQAEIDALKAAQTWQPIETAPKDSTRKMLLGCGREGVWIDKPWSPAISVGCWRDDQWRGYQWTLHPTHWLPIPNPPETTK